MVFLVFFAGESEFDQATRASRDINHTRTFGPIPELARWAFAGNPISTALTHPLIAPIGCSLSPGGTPPSALRARFHVRFDSSETNHCCSRPPQRESMTGGFGGRCCAPGGRCKAVDGRGQGGRWDRNAMIVAFGHGDIRDNPFFSDIPTAPLARKVNRSALTQRRLCVLQLLPLVGSHVQQTRW